MKAIEPKQEFLKSPEAALFADSINTPIVRKALDTALLQMLMEQPLRDTFEATAKNDYQLQGAKRFISIFINLTEPESTPKPDKSGQLTWQSKVPPPQPLKHRPSRPPKP